jgi:hypothetical protein
MNFFKGIYVTFLFFCIFIGCSTVKHFTPNNYEHGDRKLETIYKDSTTILINDLRKSVDDRTKSVIEQILIDSLNSTANNGEIVKKQ